MREQAAQHQQPLPPFVEFWPTLSDATGLKGINSLAFSAGIKDKNWHTRAFLGAPAPRRGILSLLDNAPIKPADLLLLGTKEGVQTLRPT